MADLVVTNWCGETHYAVDFCGKGKPLSPVLDIEIARYPLSEAEAGCSLGVLIAAAKAEALTVQKNASLFPKTKRETTK
jgi:hypothetical protein